MAIMFRAIKPASPHLNGKFEQAQKTVFDNFNLAVDINSSTSHQEHSAWQHYYNRHNLHISLGEITPIDVAANYFRRLLIHMR